MTCPYCKSLMVQTPLGLICISKTNEAHVCGVTLGDSEQVRKEVKA